MNILVTGGAGFIGSHTADRLIEEGHRVTVIDNLSTGKKENLNPRASFIKMDIRDAGLRELIEKERFEAVFHFAAQMDVRRSVEEPRYDADINIIGHLNLLEGCAASGTGKFIFASSGGVMYGECTSERPDEGKCPRPGSPYGISKLAGEAYLDFCAEASGMESVSLRFANVYGPRQDPRGEAGVVAIFSGAMLKSLPVRIFGDGEQLRDYVHVLDVAEACLKALEKGTGVLNIGTGRSESVNTLFEILSRKAGYGKDPEFLSARPGELQISRMDPSRAESELGWRAGIDLESGLESTFEYFRKKGSSCENR